MFCSQFFLFLSFDFEILSVVTIVTMTAASSVSAFDTDVKMWVFCVCSAFFVFLLQFWFLICAVPSCPQPPTPPPPSPPPPASPLEIKGITIRLWRQDSLSQISVRLFLKIRIDTGTELVYQSANQQSASKVSYLVQSHRPGWSAFSVHVHFGPENFPRTDEAEKKILAAAWLT